MLNAKLLQSNLVRVVTVIIAMVIIIAAFFIMTNGLNFVRIVEDELELIVTAAEQVECSKIQTQRMNSNSQFTRGALAHTTCEDPEHGTLHYRVSFFEDAEADDWNTIVATQTAFAMGIGGGLTDDCDFYALSQKTLDDMNRESTTYRLASVRLLCGSVEVSYVGTAFQYTEGVLLVVTPHIVRAEVEQENESLMMARAREMMSAEARNYENCVYTENEGAEGVRIFAECDGDANIIVYLSTDQSESWDDVVILELENALGDITECTTNVFEHDDANTNMLSFVVLTCTDGDEVIVYRGTALSQFDGTILVAIGPQRIGQVAE